MIALTSSSLVLTAERAARRQARCLISGASALAMVALGASPHQPPRLVWNASASAPIGLYSVSPNRQLKRGDLVIAWPPPAARELAARRRYLPRNVPLVKQVAALDGDRICARGDALLVNGHRLAHRLRADAVGRSLPWWHGCTTLQSGQFLLLMPGAASSFDGRYFGPIARAHILGKAHALWLR